MNKENLPPFISTADPGSFAEHTLLHRMPQIIDQVISYNEPPPGVRNKLLALKKELKDGEITSPLGTSPLGTSSLGTSSFKNSTLQDNEIRMWEEQIKLYEGKSWRNVPWYFAEALFYLKILIAFRYFEKGSGFYFKDPFQKAKDRELFSERGSLSSAISIIEYIHGVDSWEEKIKALIHASLWGNRIDLSNLSIAIGAGKRILKKQENNLIIDHSEMLAERLLQSERVTVIADNCGTELICDLLLSENLLQCSDNTVVHIHFKKYPMFVSDAMLKDADQTLDALISHNYKEVSDTGKRLESFTADNRLVFYDHFFWNTPLHYKDFSEDLRSELMKQDIVILKGDVNYRRLLSDRRWPPWTDMEAIAGYFPASFAVLRTMKSEIVVDIKREMVEILSSNDPEWMINGERGIIRMGGGLPDS